MVGPIFHTPNPLTPLRDGAEFISFPGAQKSLSVRPTDEHVFSVSKVVDGTGVESKLR